MEYDDAVFQYITLEQEDEDEIERNSDQIKLMITSNETFGSSSVTCSS